MLYLLECGSCGCEAWKWVAVAIAVSGQLADRGSSSNADVETPPKSELVNRNSEALGIALGSLVWLSLSLVAPRVRSSPLVGLCTPNVA